MAYESQEIHSRRVINEYSMKSSVPESLEDSVQGLENLMEVLSELPSEWIDSTRVYEDLKNKDGRSPSRRTIRRWINKLESKGMVKKRGTTRSTEVFSLVEK
ncbi:MAG: winged-helix domain-containing protein [Candidatus Nanohaloarchaea archaeon]